MSTKTLRFTDKDDEKMEIIRKEVELLYGIDSDIGIVRFLMSHYMNNKDKQTQSQPKPKKKEEKFPAGFLEELETLKDPNVLELPCYKHFLMPYKMCNCLLNDNAVMNIMNKYSCWRLPEDYVEHTPPDYTPMK